MIYTHFELDLEALQVREPKIGHWYILNATEKRDKKIGILRDVSGILYLDAYKELVVIDQADLLREVQLYIVPANPWGKKKPIVDNPHAGQQWANQQAWESFEVFKEKERYLLPNHIVTGEMIANHMYKKIPLNELVIEGVDDGTTNIYFKQKEVTRDHWDVLAEEYSQFVATTGRYFSNGDLSFRTFITNIKHKYSLTLS